MNLAIKLAVWIIISGMIIGLGIDKEINTLKVGGIFSTIIAIVYLMMSYLDRKFE